MPYFTALTRMHTPYTYMIPFYIHANLSLYEYAFDLVSCSLFWSKLHSQVHATTSLFWLKSYPCVYVHTIASQLWSQRHTPICIYDKASDWCTHYHFLISYMCVCVISIIILLIIYILMLAVIMFNHIYISICLSSLPFTFNSNIVSF